MKKNYESIEDYLENIYILSKGNNKLHAIDIANLTGFSKPSISRAVHRLLKDELITIDDDKHIHLTNNGILKATKIYERHLLLTKALMFIGVDPQTAEGDACRIEHVISDTTFDIIKDKLNKLK
ncbi:MAG: metal-dependent transcriptional regulator [Acholeplasmatales bacterium]|jgi:Mn-dependent DtxR family transcriptional regulator|nr:metal-dependent transcriptional regulator [Acholeplasmatales bacterium]